MSKGQRGEYKNGRWALVDADGNALTEYKYFFVEPCGEGYFRAQVTGASKFNLLTPEGQQIFRDSYSYISEVHNGVAICYNTIRKTQTTPTHYLHGILHVSGQVLIEPSFKNMYWFNAKYEEEDEDEWRIFAEKEECCCEFNAEPELGNDGLFTLPICADNEKDFPFEVVPWQPFQYTPCQGCVYSRLIPRDWSRCGRLTDAKAFRFKLISLACLYRKESLLELSEFEKREQRKQEQEAAAKEKQTGSYPHRLVKEFVDECLGGDLTRLTTFNFSYLLGQKQWQKFVSPRGTRESVERMEIVRALLYVLWGEAWPGCDFEQIEKQKYQKDDVLSFFHMFMSGLDHGKGCFKVLAEDHFPFPETLRLRVYNLWPRFNSIVNMTLLPAGITRAAVERNITRGKRMWREYPDIFLSTWREAILRPASQPYAIQNCIKANKKAYAHIKTERDFNATMHTLTLDDFISPDGSIPKIFDHIFVGQKDLRPEEYFPIADRYLTLCEQFFNRREKLIVERLTYVFEK